MKLRWGGTGVGRCVCTLSWNIVSFSRGDLSIVILLLSLFLSDSIRDKEDSSPYL